ncbi:hypothetical protein IFM89_031874 [Coptis chinensis]|uniref:Mitochondrial fission 1 protein n=1 Tax=Coptis chinensis TaxID=261450 RepID=A0A835IRD5_9MAGN|nr:hypothetical protein IFM89_031874 [Coptis chinensis]
MFRSVHHYLTLVMVILGCDREIAEAANGTSDEIKKESIMRLSWALVHSKQPEDVQRGLAMLEDSLVSPGSPLQKREKLYLMAVRNFRSVDYSRSRSHLIGGRPCLKKTVEDKIAEDGAIGIGIATTAARLVVGGIVAALARKK